MSEFMDRARAETEGRWSVIALGREQATRCRNAFADGAQWASEQEPTDAEVEAAARALCDITYGLDWLRLVDGWKNKPYPDFPHLVDDLRDQARSALLAAQKVRAGQ